MPTNTKWCILHWVLWHPTQLFSQANAPSSGFWQCWQLLTQAIPISGELLLADESHSARRFTTTNPPPTPNSKTCCLMTRLQLYKSSNLCFKGDLLRFHPYFGIPLESGWCWTPAESKGLSCFIICHMPQPSMCWEYNLNKVQAYGSCVRLSGNSA